MPMRPAFRRPLFHKERALPRMSWNTENLYNLWQRVASDGPLNYETNFSRTSMTLFQQRWRSKALGRGYHGDHIGATKFERWYLPDALPSIHSGGASSSTKPNSSSSSSKSIASFVAGRMREGGRQEVERNRVAKEREGRAAIGTMLYREVERRVDVLIFRACFATSVWQARQMVVHGQVRVNGLTMSNANVRLNPGDIFSVNPEAIAMLSERSANRAVRSAKRVAMKTKKAIASVPKPKQKDEEEVVKVGEESQETPSEEIVKGEEASSTEDPLKEEDSTKPASTSKSSSTPTPKPKAFFTLPPYAAPHIFIPAYLEVSFKTCTAVYVRHPTARPGYSEIPSPYDADGEIMSLGWEWFKKKAPNMEKRRHRWMSPERESDRK